MSYISMQALSNGVHEVRWIRRQPLDGYRKVPKLEYVTLCNYYSKQYDDYRLLLVRRVIPSIESHQSQKYEIVKELS